MKVLIVNTSERNGGAAVAASRLAEALTNNGVKAMMLVRDKETERPTVVRLPKSMATRWHFLWERLCIYAHLHFRRDHLFEIDVANSGTDITRLREFREADVVHLHWVNQGMLSLRTIRKILRTGKPVVWTMHDAWPATAICHLSLGCRHFTSGCHHCRYLPGGGNSNDLSARVWRNKVRMLAGGEVSFVACSRWLEGEAKASALLRGHRITTIPNPIDTRVFCPGSRQAARRALGLPEKGRLLLFVCQRLTNAYKGMDYLIEACRRLSEQHSDAAPDTGVVLLGGNADEMAGKLPFKAWPMGYVSDEKRIVQVYQAADVFVLPSLSENLPNTIMEAMACGLPAVAFRVGGIPEMIDHKKNGYVAAYRDADDLARGLSWALFESDPQQTSHLAVTKVMHNYAQTSVAIKYIEVYQEAMAHKNFNF